MTVSRQVKDGIVRQSLRIVDERGLGIAVLRTPIIFGQKEIWTTKASMRPQRNSLAIRLGRRKRVLHVVEMVSARSLE